MAIMNVALLALVPFVLARPQVGHADAHKGLHVPRWAGTGLPGPFSHSAPAASGSAPFPVPGGNGTSGAATGSTGIATPSSSSAGGPVVITSIISVVPQPPEVYQTSTAYETNTAYVTAQGPGGPGNSQSPASETGAPGGGPGGPEASGSGSGGECGPATVTITQANTVTVTVTPAASNAGPGGVSTNGGAVSPPPVIPSSAYIPPSQSAPFPIGNSSVPQGTGTGVAPTQTVAPVEVTSSSTPAIQPPVFTPASSSAAAPSPHVPQSAPPAPYSQPAPGPPPASSVAAPVASSAAGPVASTQPTTGGPKGVAYLTEAQATQISGLSWGCNWGQTSLVTNPEFDFVPQLWGQKPGMADSIQSNCASAKACLFYNEPDQPLGAGGSQIDAGQCASDYQSIMLKIRKAGTKTSTPCVANSGLDFMGEFLSSVEQLVGKGQIDIMCFHWYGEGVENLQQVVGQFKSLADQHGIPELWINEWAVQPPPADLSDYTKYLDGAVARYAYNMLDMEGSTGY